MDSGRYVIITKENKPVMFDDETVLIYPTLKEAVEDYHSKYDKDITTLENYKKTEMYKRYNKFSFGM